MILSILNEIAAISSTKAKLAILQHNKDNELLKRVYRLTYHKQVMFGIKKFPIIQHDFIGMELSEALDFLEFELAKRVVTGNAAIIELGSVLAMLSANDVEVIRRVLLRDLECGASSTMANKVWKGLIPSQPQMLASSMSEKSLQIIKYPAYAQLKADGARCFAEVRGYDNSDEITLLTRSGNEYLKLDTIKQEILNIAIQHGFNEIFPQGFMIDGELVQSNNNRQNSNGVANKSLKNTITTDEAESMQFQVWDLVDINTVDGGGESVLYDDRFKLLTDISKDFNKLVLIENAIVNSLDEAKQVYMKYVEQGLEGIILKNIKSVWENKRSKNLVKFKEEIMIDLEIIDCYVHQKDENKLGGITLKSSCGKILVNCGSGFSDTTHKTITNLETGVADIEEYIPLDQRKELDREYLWSIKDDLIGKIVEVKCNGAVTSRGRDTLSLFLPIIMNIRDDKLVADSYETIFN